MPSSHTPSCKSHKTTASVSFVGQMLQQSFYCLDSESSKQWVGIISEKALNTSFTSYLMNLYTLESLIDVGQGISIGPGRFGKNKKT